MIKGTSKNRRERPECKGYCAQEPEYIFEYMRIPSTAARSSRVAQQVFRGALKRLVAIWLWLGTHRHKASLIAGLFLLSMVRPTLPSLLIGTPIALVGVIIRIWASGHLHKNHRLAMDGPYHLSRHPLYLGNFLIGVAICMMGTNPLMMLGFFALFSTIYTATIVSEEQSLRHRFGRAYDAYCENVPCFFPLLKTVQTGGRKGETFAWQRVSQNSEYRTWVGLLSIVICLILQTLL